MNVLLIAPDSNLPAAQNEVRAVAMALHAVALTGVVNRKDVLDALAGHTWDVVWFACHGDQAGIQLTDGPILIADLTAIIRNSGAYLVVLNTCSSRFVGLELHYELGVAVVCTEGPADDLTAYQTGTLLARNLAEGKAITEAFNRAKPGQNHLFNLFIRQDGGESDEELRTIRMMNEWFNRFGSRMDKIEAEFKRDLNELRQEVATIKPHIDTLARTVELTPKHQHTFYSAFVLLFLPLPLFYSQVRDMLGVSWYMALLLAAIAYTASASLWRYMWWGNRRADNR